MTDPQLPPSGAVPPVPPAPQPPQPAQPDAAQQQPAPQPPSAPPAYTPAPPAPQPPAPSSAPVAPPAPTAYAAPPAPPAYAAPGAPYGAPAPQAAPAPYAAPVPQAAPPGAYQVPVGGYAAPSGAYQVPATTERTSSLLGILALVFALAAAVLMPIIAGVTGFEIGRRIPGGIDTTTSDLLTVLSPARDQVLWAEISFWVGTLLGIAAIVVGILAIRRKQGRGLGITALVVAVLGPVIFWVVVLATVSAGTAAGFLS